MGQLLVMEGDAPEGALAGPQVAFQAVCVPRLRLLGQEGGQVGSGICRGGQQRKLLASPIGGCRGMDAQARATASPVRQRTAAQRQARLGSCQDHGCGLSSPLTSAGDLGLPIGDPVRKEGFLARPPQIQFSSCCRFAFVVYPQGIYPGRKNRSIRSMPSALKARCPAGNSTLKRINCSATRWLMMYGSDTVMGLAC